MVTMALFWIGLRNEAAIAAIWAGHSHHSELCQEGNPFRNALL